MTHQRNVLDPGVILIDLIDELFGRTGWCQVLGGNDFFFSQVELLLQDFRRLGCSNVRAGQDQVYLHFQIL